MKVIETVYNGYRFRSRLEARWAVFFDHVGIAYQYEPEAYDLSSVLCRGEDHYESAECCCRAQESLSGHTAYLPDFFLTNVSLRNETTRGIFFEVKGTTDSISDAKATLLGHSTDTPVIVAVGPPFTSNSCLEEGLYQLYPYWDNYMQFMRCCSCLAVKIAFLNRESTQCVFCGRDDMTSEHRSLFHASTVARSWRFEPQKEGL